MIMSGGDRHHHQDDNDGNEKALDFSTIEVTEDVKETLILKDKLHSTSNDNYDDNEKTQSVPGFTCKRD